MLVDVDAFVAMHQGEWRHLRTLTRSRHLDGPQSDELVRLYQSTATQLSTLRTQAPDPSLIGYLSSTVASARSRIVGTKSSPWQAMWRFATVSFPAATYRLRYWWLIIAVSFLVVTIATAAWVAHSPSVQAALVPPDQARQLVQHDFRDYYSSAPAGAFAAKVWTNNAWVAALTVMGGALLCLPAIYVLFTNAMNTGLVAGYMVAGGRTTEFFALILPHGMLELSAVFMAAAAGIKLGWAVIDPGRLRRSEALAQAGRSLVTVVIGLVAVLFVSGLIEAFVTPSSLPTWARIGIGLVVWLLAATYVLVLGRRGAMAEEIGDVDVVDLPDVVPTAG